MRLCKPCESFQNQGTAYGMNCAAYRMKPGAMISGGPGEKPVNQKTAKCQHSPSAGHLAWADYVTNEEGIANYGERVCSKPSRCVNGATCVAIFLANPLEVALSTAVS